MGYSYLFSYGTFIDQEVQHILFDRSVTVGPAILPQHNRYADADGYYYVLPEPGFNVQGELLSLSAEELVTADLWENVPDYVRVSTSVLLPNGAAVTAYVYYRSSPQAKLPAPPGTLAAVPRSQVIAAAGEFAACERKGEQV